MADWCRSRPKDRLPNRETAAAPDPLNGESSQSFTLNFCKPQGKQAVAEIGMTKVLNPTFIE
jgi:hypothetical protein